MRRSTQAQKAARLNAAHALLAEGMEMSDAATVLARSYALSRRQAYRYLEEARTLAGPVAEREEPVALTVKLPASQVEQLRAHAGAHEVTISSVVSRAIAAYLAPGSTRG
jgi:transposase